MLVKRNNGNYKNVDSYFTNSQLITKWLYIRRKVIRKFTPWIPRQLWIGVTYQCQCQCVHCFLGPYLNKGKDELTKEEIFHLINTARRLGFLEVSYFGGEPLLREDLPDFIRFSNSRGLLTSVYTNGILLDKEKVKDLRKAGLSLCNVSIDSAFSDSHNTLRGYKGCFEKAMEGIKNLVDAEIPCSIWTYVKKSDVEDPELKSLRNLIKIGKDLNVKKVVILFPMASGNWLCGVENILTQTERDKIRILHNPPFVTMEFPDENVYCRAGERMVYINPQGAVSPCPTVPYFFGNIREETLSAILKKLHNSFVKPSKGGCGECIMNDNTYRGEIGVDLPVIKNKSKS